MSSLSVAFLVVQSLAGALAAGRWLAWKREAVEEARHSRFLRGVMRDQMREAQVARDRVERLGVALELQRKERKRVALEVIFLRADVAVWRARADRLEAAARSAGVVLVPVVDTVSTFVVTPETQSAPGRKEE